MLPGDRRRQQDEKSERARQTGQAAPPKSGGTRRDAQLTRGKSAVGLTCSGFRPRPGIEGLIRSGEPTRPAGNVPGPGYQHTAPRPLRCRFPTTIIGCSRHGSHSPRKRVRRCAARVRSRWLPRCHLSRNPVRYRAAGSAVSADCKSLICADPKFLILGLSLKVLRAALLAEPTEREVCGNVQMGDNDVVEAPSGPRRLEGRVVATLWSEPLDDPLLDRGRPDGPGSRGRRIGVCAAAAGRIERPHLHSLSHNQLGATTRFLQCPSTQVNHGQRTHSRRERRSYLHHRASSFQCFLHVATQALARLRWQSAPSDGRGRTCGGHEGAPFPEQLGGWPQRTPVADYRSCCHFEPGRLTTTTCHRDVNRSEPLTRAPCLPPGKQLQRVPMTRRHGVPPLGS